MESGRIEPSKPYEMCLFSRQSSRLKGITSTLTVHSAVPARFRSNSVPIPKIEITFHDEDKKEDADNIDANVKNPPDQLPQRKSDGVGLGDDIREVSMKNDDFWSAHKKRFHSTH